MIGFSTSLEGLSRAEAQFNQAAQNIADMPVAASNGQLDTVDLSAAAVAMIQAKNNFDANTKAIKVGDEMYRTLLDAIG
ncbi:MAG TPA: flagellar basal body rod C-terminal domain-containing protein [Bryobacteraceae bacterium]|nr:flagellar basal body rod C-terminal domain-containing protein [Bryobacteraceae bacterium]